MSYTENGGPLRDAARQRTTAVLFPAMLHLDQIEKRDQAQQWTFMAICDVLEERHDLDALIDDMIDDDDLSDLTYGEMVAAAIAIRQAIA